MAIKLTNNAASRLAGNISASSTTINVIPGEGSKFPALSSGDWFPATIIDSVGNIEIIKVTARSSDTLTVQRAKESTSAMAFDAGCRIEHRITAESLSMMLADISSRLSASGGTISGDLIISGNLNGGTPYTSANFNPATKFNVSGGALTGALTSAPVNSPMATSDSTASIQVQNNTGTGDSNMAMMSFVCQGSYGIKMGLRADGYFGLGGWSASSWRWYVNAATGDMVAAGNVGAYSDPRLKDDVSRIDGALGIIKRLDGVRFTWNGKSKLIGKPGQRDIGVLADQVENVLPELVGRSVHDQDNDGTQWRVVSYDKLAPVLIEAVKELAARVEKLEA